MREQDRTSTCVRFQTGKNVLEERIVSTTLGWCSQEITSILVVFKSTAIPLADGVWRISQYQIKLLDHTFLDESRTFQCIVIDNMEIINAMKKEIHSSNSTGKLVDFLSIYLQITPFLALVLKVRNTGNKHASTAAGGIINRFSALRLEHFRHQMHHSTVGIEFLGGMSAVISKLLNQVFIALAQLVFRTVSQGQYLGREMLNKISKKAVGQTVFISPRTVAENTGHAVTVDSLDLPEGFHDSCANIFGHLTDIVPMISFGDQKCM